MFELQDEDKYPAITKYKNLLLEGMDNYLSLTYIPLGFFH